MAEAGLHRRNTIPIIVTVIAILLVMFVPHSFEERTFPNTERVAGLILSTDDTYVVDVGLIRTGEQLCEVELLGGRRKVRHETGTNILAGSLEQDKFFAPGDKALVTVDFFEDDIKAVTLVDHYRINWEIFLVALFVIALVSFAGIIGFKSLLSFIFSIVVIWRVLIPMFLLGYNPVLVGCVTAFILTTVIVGLVYGFDRRSLAAIIGALLGLGVTCLMAIYFVGVFKIHGAVMPFSEQLLYSGYSWLNLTQVFIAGIFIASSGAVMDLAVDITSAVAEVVAKKPEISRFEAVKSGMNVGRAVLGTMSTTLLLAYSGGYIGLLMVFMAQQIPLINILNLKFVSSEILHTIIGSFGLVTVAPFTALAAGLLLAGAAGRAQKRQQREP